MILKKIIGRYQSMPLGVKAALWFTICSFLQQGVSFLVTPIFTRLMTTEEYGIYSVFMSWKGILTVFVTLQLAAGGFSKGLLKFPNRDVYQSVLMSVTLVSVLIWSSVILFAGCYVSKLLDIPVKYLFSLLIMLLFQQAFSLWAARQRFEYRYKSLVSLTLLTTVLAPCLSIGAIKSGVYSVDARIYAQVVVNAVAYGPLMIMIFVRGKTFFNKDICKYAIPFGLTMIPHALANNVLSSSDRIMISQIVGNSEAALYNVGYAIANVILIFINSVMGAFNPWMMRRADKKDYANVAGITNMLGIFFCLIALIPILAGPEVVALMGGRKYADSIWIIPPVAASIYFIFLHCLFSVILFYYEKKIFILSASCSAAVLNIILNVIFIDLFGYVAAAYTTLACYAFFPLLDYVFLCKLRRENNINSSIYDYKSLALMSALVIFTALFGNLLYLNEAVRYVFLLMTVLILFFKRSIFIGIYKKMKQR